MEKSLSFVLSKIRKRQRTEYPDYFITINQPKGFAATISRERNGSISMHYHDNGMLTFDPQQVDSFENIKLSDLNKLNLLKIAISVDDFSGELLPELKNEVHEGMVLLRSFLRLYLQLDVENSKNSEFYQWFIELLNSEKEQQFLRHHLGTIRYFHGDFEPLKEFLLGDTSDHSTEEDSFFEDDEDIDFEDDNHT